jgi:hypothetical protein
MPWAFTTTSANLTDDKTFKKKKPPGIGGFFLVNHPPEMWNLILEELKQLYVLQTEENRAIAFAR